MLFKETVADYCENHTKHTNTLMWAENSVRTSQETHHVTATKPNRLMLFRETVAVYCENNTEHIDTLCGQNAEF
jgi:predicted Zn-dependent protease with MMP-like domain